MPTTKAHEFYHLNELSDVDETVLLYEEMDDWLRPSIVPVVLSNGREFKVSFQELKHINEVVFKLNHSTIDYSYTINTGSVLFLINSETHSITWSPNEFIPNGYIKENNFWIYRESNELQIFPTYPENVEDVEQDFLMRMNASRVDHLTLKSTADVDAVEKVKDANILLNKLIEERLEKNESLEEARRNVELQQKEVLNLILMGLIDAFGIHGVYGLGTPSILDTYLRLTEDGNDSISETGDSGGAANASASNKSIDSNENADSVQLDQTSSHVDTWQENIDHGLSANANIASDYSGQKSFMDDLYHPDETDQTPAQTSGSESHHNIDALNETPVQAENDDDDKSSWSEQTMIAYPNEKNSVEKPHDTFLSHQSTLSESFDPFAAVDQCNADGHDDADSNGYHPEDIPFEGD